MKPKDEIEKLADKCLGSWTNKKEYQHIRTAFILGYEKSEQENELYLESLEKIKKAFLKWQTTQGGKADSTFSNKINKAILILDKK